MRPYTGIGVVVFRQSDKSQIQELQLYKEPGLSRVGVLNRARLSGNEWVFGPYEGPSPLVVSARKGDWLKIYYDNAGREAWIDPQNKGHFESWEQFLRQQTGRLLPGLQQKYYQLQQQPGGRLLATLSPKQVFKVLKLENDWGTVLTDQAQIGWLRWRDEDGRLLIGGFH
jgi:SH3-like domain-containing protein